MHINHLPVEILGEIFDMAASRGYLTHNDFVPILLALRPSFAPLSLIYVCRLWRNVAFSLPSLWNSINGTQHEALQPPTRAISFWLACSRNAPLHLYLSSWQDSEGPCFDPQHSRKMLQLFTAHIHRWRSLSIEVGKELAEDLIAIFQGVARDPPPLEGLEIDFRHREVSPSSIETLCSLFSDIGTLRRLYWMNIHGYTIPRMPWGQFETISIETSFDPEESMDCLAQCSSARSVCILGWGDPPHHLSIPNRRHITLESLTSLTLNKSSDPLPMLSHFTLPSLEYLEVGIYQRDFQSLEAFLTRSRCPLKTLIVIDTTFQAEDIAHFFTFQWLKGIRDVKLGPTHSDTKMSKLLQQLRAKHADLPRLVVWDERHLDWPMFIGWKESDLQGVRYVFEKGQVTRREKSVQNIHLD